MASNSILIATLLLAGFTSGPPVIVGSSSDKVKMACLAINEAMYNELTPDEVAWCEKNLAVWYAESRFPRADPADELTGIEQLDYFRDAMGGCVRAANRYDQQGILRRNMLMRCLVIKRK